MRIINKIKNKLIKWGRRTQVFRATKSQLLESLIRFKKETPAETENRIRLSESIHHLHNRNVACINLWDKYRHDLRSYILAHDPRNFLRWEPITDTMFAGAHKSEFEYLLKNNWDRWSEVIKENWIGNPPHYKYHKESSSNLVHTAYNLSQLIDRYNIDLKKIEKIVEFGGGYGCMSKLINNIGFRGQYVIFDTPEFLALQKYYSNLNNIGQDYILTDSIEKIGEPNPDIFIATWSLSESPLKLRDEFLKKLGEPKYVLIAYQAKIESIDNIGYFEQYKKRYKDYEWTNHNIPHLPANSGNYYLIGKKVS